MKVKKAAAWMLLFLLFTGCGTVPIPQGDPAESLPVTGEAVITASETTYASTTTTKPAAPADELQIMLTNMTTEQKAAQMVLASCTDDTLATGAAAAGAGGLCLFSQSFSGKNKEQVREMTAQFQSSANIPLLIAVDEEGGSINRISIHSSLRAVPFWSSRKLYAEGGWALIISDTKEKAELLLDLGVNVNLAPVCDVPLASGNYIYPRCFSLDPTETADYVRTVVTEMKADGLGSTLKHFPGYGGSVDTHKRMSYDSRDYTAFTEGDFLPFIAGIEAGADAVMVSHNIVECMDAEHPASLSPAVHEILRETLGFHGVIITDDLDMQAITEYTGGQNPAVTAVLAGNDLICYSQYEESIAAIVQAIEDGTVSEDQVNASVLRILRWKRSLGII